MQDEVGFIDEKYLKNPHIKYYAERTNWTKVSSYLTKLILSTTTCRVRLYLA